MTVDVEQLFTLLWELDDPDCQARPRDYRPEDAQARFILLAAELDKIYDCRCAVVREPPGSAHFGSITVPAAATAVRHDVEVLVGKFGHEASLGHAGTLPPDAAKPFAMPTDEDIERVTKVLFTLGYTRVHPAPALIPQRRPLRYPRLISATTTTPLTDEQFRCEVERIEAVAAALNDPEERRWLAVDDEILDTRPIWAVKAICDEFECTLREALELHEQRYNVLRESRPYGFAAGPPQTGEIYT